jgi:hypothetical protein
MITEKAIKNGDTFTHSGKNLTGFGSSFDGENFYFFESEQEKINYYKSIETLENYKKQLIDLQDKKTEDLILSGFTFDGSLFSLSINAQINWSNLLNIPQQMFPLNLSTKDDNIYVLNFNNVQSFYFTALGKKSEYLQSGNDVKKRINESLTIQELDTIKLEIWG